MNLSNPTEIQALLRRHGFHFSKSMGQNFLIDPEVCPEMARLCGASDCAGVLEIGPGIGVLTQQLARVADKVLAVELDRRLLPLLAETLSENENVTVVQGDVLALDLPALLSDHFDGDICVCANLPYYITSPVLMMLLETPLHIRTITVMVQKEAAQRICAPPGVRACGAISIGVHYRCVPELLFEVPRTAFLPSPNVDSAVIRLNLLAQPPVSVHEEAALFRLTKAAFSQRRKTAVNSISSVLGIEKPVLQTALAALGLSASIRAEQLTLPQFAAFTNQLTEKGVL